MTSLWTRNFTFYFGARAVSLLGDAMMPVAVALAVGRLYGIAGVGYVLALWTGSFVLFILFGGVFADRLGARAMMIGADLVRVLTQGAVAFAFFTGTPSFALLLTTSFLTGVATAMFQPGVNGMVPRVAGDPQRANATLKFADAVTQLGGPALAGVLMMVTGPAFVYTLDAATFLISGLCLVFVRVSGPARKARSSMLSDLRHGWREFRARTWMWSVILVWVFWGVLVVGPYIPLSSQLIGADYGWVMAALGLGTVLGGLLAIRFRPERPLAAGAVALAGYAPMPLLVALGAPLPGLMAAHVFAGAAMAFWSVMWSTSVQTQVAPDVLNRVTAYEIAGSVAGMAVGQALAGPVTTVVAPRDFMVGSAVTSVAVMSALLLIPPIRRLRRVPAAPGGHAASRPSTHDDHERRHGTGFAVPAKNFAPGHGDGAGWSDHPHHPEERRWTHSSGKTNTALRSSSSAVTPTGCSSPR
ncbi:MFS transporter [Spongiactinospora sp. TRM90649]|uniref:MFS transporter n=1 Tax=Spongiactinospora sp. TRM90649 TaxID=3031114 RepID=UPI0023FA3B82|nr:MFS transporter [Spongiactinospora sp. TRM90649]MDF5753872.1 MFS transporter [Spongiactinospora sp. TRM90649]